mgnify:CR=1 FL=1
MKTTIKFGVIALLSMALFVMAFAAVPIASADSNCAYAMSVAGPVIGRPGWSMFAAWSVISCPNVYYCNLYVTLTVNGVVIPPSQAPDPCEWEFQGTINSYGAWVHGYCSEHGDF